MSSRSNRRSINPWLSMWPQPRHTIRYLRAKEPTYGVLLLAIAAGLSNTLGQTLQFPMLSEWSVYARLGIEVPAGIIFGIVSLYFFGWLLKVTGKWLDGDASARSMRLVLAWSNLPLLWLLPLTIATVVLAGNIDMNTVESANLPLFTVLMAIRIIQSIVSLWVLALFVIGISEVQGFSIGKAIGNMLLVMLFGVIALLLAGILVMIPVMILSPAAA